MTTKHFQPFATLFAQKWVFFTALFSFFFSAVTSGVNASEKVALPIPPLVHKQLNDVVSKYPGLSGQAVLITPQNTFFVNFGNVPVDANAQAIEPVSASTVFRLGSITKSFTAIALLKLIEQYPDKVALDDPISKFIEDGWITNSYANDITLAQLLEHTAGFTDISGEEFDFNEPIPLEDALLKFKQYHHTRWNPGEFSSYSNLGAGFVGYVIEQVSGKPYEDFLAEVVLNPLGMTTAGFKQSSVRVIGYKSDGVTVIPYWHTVYRPFGGLNASALDMSRYLQELLNPKLLSAKELQQFITPNTGLAAESGLTFGYALGNYTALVEDYLFHGHSGDADGYLSRFGFSQEAEGAYYVVINRFDRALVSRLQDVLANAVVAHAKRPPPKAPKILTITDNYQWIDGRYTEATARFINEDKSTAEFGQIYFDTRKNVIRVKRAGRSDSLWYPVAIGKNKEGEEWVSVRHNYENRATAVFLKKKDGRIAFITEFWNLVKM